MSTPSPALDGSRAVELVLAATAPLSLDQLVAWNVARPSDLWRFLESATAQGWVARDDRAASGLFAFRDEARRNEVIASAGPDDWRWLFGLEASVPLMIAAAREAARSRRLDTASRLYAALVRLPARDTFPGGARGWLEVVGEGTRRFRIVEWLEPALLDEALELAVAAGDLPLQAVLSGARGFAASRERRMEEAHGFFERALEAAGALRDRSIAYEVHVQVAFGQILQGRPRDAIATFERLLGDLPAEFVPLPAEMAHPMSAVPEAPLAVLGAMYGQTGQYGRAFDMLHRMQKAGERLGRADLVASAQSFLGALHAGRRDVDAARAEIEPAFAYWRAAGGEPWYLWHASNALAWVRAQEGRLGEAREVLEVGQRARLASGLMYFAGSHLFETLERLDADGVAPVAGVGLDGEIERMMAWPDAFMRAVAYRYRARQLSRAAPDAATELEIDRLHAAGLALLRDGTPSVAELARSLDEAARWAERRGRSEEAGRLSAEAREVYASIGLASPAGGESSRIRAALVELGRLGSLANRTEGVWGEIASRLCAALGAERCALVESGPDGTRTLAARGGGPEWIEVVGELARARSGLAAQTRAEALTPPASGDEPAGGGQLLVVPFAAERVQKRGHAFLENRHGAPLVGPKDEALLAVVQAQLGVVLENVAMWQELVAARQRLEQENRYYRDVTPAAGPRGRIIGDSPALRAVLGLVARVAPSTTSVLVHGETGVGKELVARELHRLSPRRDRPFIAVHVASLAPGLVASGLFGHERGAFTGATEQAKGRFELADGGTLFLDEVGELGLEDQVRLLRVLQEGTFERVGGTKQLRSDFRLVAATNRDLQAEVKAGRFREDLYFRLAAFPIYVPPLRDRTEEIPTLALYFMEAAARKIAVRFDGIGEADMERLIDYPWPGNVRELEHVIERATLLSEPPRLRIPPLYDAFGGGPSHAAPAPEWITLEESERRYLRQVIAHTAGRITGKGGAAELLGLSPSTLTWRIGKLGLKEELKRARAAKP